MYKKLLLAFFIIVLSCLLSSCGTPAEADTSLLLDDKFDTAEFLPEYDFRNEFGKWREMCESEQAYYFSLIDNPYLYYYDKESGISGVLCGKPDCDHSNVSCNAYLAGGSGLALYDGYLYWTQAPSTLFRMKLDGTERETFQSLQGGLSSSVWLHRGYIYSIQEISSVVDGKSTTSIRLSQEVLGDPDRELVVILEQEAVDYFYQVLGNTIYLGLEQYSTVEDTTGTISTLSLYAYDSATGKLDTLVERSDSFPFNFRDMRCLENKIYFSAYNETNSALYQYNANTHSIDLVRETGLAMALHLGENYAFGVTGQNDVLFSIQDFDGNVLREGQIITDPTLSIDVWGVIPKCLTSDKVLVLLVDLRPEGSPDTLYEVPLDPSKPIRVLAAIEHKLT